MQQRKCDFEFRMYRHSASKSIKSKFHSSVSQEERANRKSFVTKNFWVKTKFHAVLEITNAIPHGNISDMIFSCFIVKLEVE